jgi:hypothetical protein
MKIKILMLVLEIKTKSFFYIFEGAPELWCPNLFLGSVSGAISKRPFFAMGQKDAQF